MLLGYAEDALTLWVFAGHLGKFLHTMKDDTPIEQAVTLYRPSFGRKATHRDATLPCDYRPAFGEFDAIVGSPKGTYLIEAKWSGSSGAGRPSLDLGPAQLKRHRVMRAYIEEWRAVRPGSWGRFVAESRIRERLAVYRASVPGPKTKMAANLQNVLWRLEEFEGRVVNVLLYLHCGGTPCPTETASDDFCIVGVDCRSVVAEGFVPLPQSSIGFPPAMWRSAIQDVRMQTSLPA